MSRSHHPQPAKLFTVDDANKMLPLIKAIVSDFVGLSREVADRKQRLHHLMEGRDIQENDPYSDELSHVETELEKDVQRLEEFNNELRALGVEPKGDGIVDFPSMVEGQLVHLCWKLGESEVMHWHELDSDFNGRQPLAAGTISDS